MARKSSDDTIDNENIVEDNENIVEEINTEKAAQQTDITEEKTLCKLISRADYTITILENNNTIFIPPFGQVIVVREDVVIPYSDDAKYLTFVKL